MSEPLSSRWVAKECREVRHPAGFAIPARITAWRTRRCRANSWKWCRRRRCGRQSPRRRQRRAVFAAIPSVRAIAFTAPASFLIEVVRVDSLHVVHPRRGHTDLEVDHKLGESPAINQYNLRLDVLDVGASVTREHARCDEDPLPCTLAVQCPDELLDLRTAHAALPLLRLKIHNIEPEAVLADDTVDPFIARLPDRLPGVRSGAAIAHLQQQLDREAFKDLRCAGLDHC